MARSHSDSTTDVDAATAESGASTTGGAAASDATPTVALGDRTLQIEHPPDATDEEAAAIAAAIGAHLAEQEQAVATAAAASAGEQASWAGRRWGFAGRAAALGREPRRVPESAPTDSWTAVGRVERMR